jgi:peptidoglycan/xylan/chitin deacetylase (PgdA/CDA1 family)
MRISPAALVFGGPALAVVLISTVVTFRGGDARVPPQPARFSGSTVVQRLPSLLASPRLPAAIPVVVVRDDAAASFFDSPSALDSIIARWHEALAAAGANVRVLSATAARDDRSAHVLVVPSSSCLAIESREAMDAVWARGGGVILTGAAGTYDGGCRPLGYGFIVSATGASRAAVLEPREMTYVTIPAAGTFSADIPPGARLDLNPGKQIALRHPSRDAFYSDYSLQPQPARREPLLDAALTHGTVEGHRAVYWGFELTDIVARPWDRAIAGLLVRNSVMWAAGEPLATVEPWPRGKRAAASIAQDVESGFANARHAVDSLSAAGVRSTFYLTSSLARRYERLSRRLAQSGEIGTHGDTHRLLGGLTPRDQQARLSTTQHDLLDLVGSTALGLRPPEEQFDTTTMRAWISQKGNYLFGANDSRAAAPELLRVGRDTLVLIGRVGADDFAATARHVVDVRAVAATFLGEYDRVRALGGHYVLSYHSQVLATPELVPSLASVARRLAADTAVWVAPVGDVAEWWRARSHIETRAQLSGDVMKVSVRNTSFQTVRGAVVRVSIPGTRRVVRADTKMAPSVGRMVRLVMPPLPGRATKMVRVFLTPSR